MKKIFIGLLGIFPLLWGCFDDEGSYTYKELNTITEDSISWNYTVNEGDGLKIKPKLRFKKDSINVNLKYEWIIGDTIIEGETLDLAVYPGPLGYKRCNFKVTDLDIDLPYFFPFNVTHVAKYQTCWLLLSEKDGKSNLSVVKEKYEENSEGQIIKTTYSEEFDVYKNVNGKDLGSKPVKLVEHFTGKTMGSALAEVWVLQNGEKGTVLLNGASLKHETYLSEEFIGDQLPANFSIKDAVFFSNTHWVLSEDGKMYSRLSEDQAAYHAGRFDPEPVGGDRYDVRLLIPSCFYTLYGGLFFETKSSQYLFIYDYPYGPEESGKILTIDFNDYGDDSFTPLNNMGDRKPIFSDFRNGGYYEPTYFYSILFDESEQKFYRQYFEFEANYGFNVIPYFENEFPGDKLTKESVIALGRMTPFLFFSGGANQEKLYWIATSSDNELPRPFDFDFGDDSITSITICTDEDLGSRMGVATAKGKFYIFEINNKILTSGKPQQPLYQMQGNPGSIKDVIYKVAEADSFWHGEEGR